MMATLSSLPGIRRDGERISLAPYKATQMWNDAIDAFRTGMPVGKRRRYMKSYEACFTASAAVDWLHNYLLTSPGFNPNVTRKQATLFLEKFLQVGVIKDVRESKSNKEQITDNSRLFRFADSSQVISLPTCGPLIGRPSTLNGTKSLSALSTVKTDGPRIRPLRLFSSKENTGSNQQSNKKQMSKSVGSALDKKVEPLPECVPVLTSKVVSEEEIKNTWKHLLIESLCKELNLLSLNHILDPNVINAENIQHNCTQVNKNGVVTNIDVKDQLPSWIVSAMRCLAYWPEQVVDCMPSYRGFEADVFKVVRDHLRDLEEPLLTSALYEVFTHAFVCAERTHSSTSPLGFISNVTDPKTFKTLASVENLMMDITVQDSMCHSSTPAQRQNAFNRYGHQAEINPNLRYTPRRSKNPHYRNTYGGFTLGGDFGLETSFSLGCGEPAASKQDPLPTASRGTIDQGYSTGSQTSSASPISSDHPSPVDPAARTPHNAYVSLLAHESCYGTDEPFSTEYSNHPSTQHIARVSTPHESRCVSLDDVHKVAPTPENQLYKMSRVHDWAMSISKQSASDVNLQTEEDNVGGDSDLSNHLSYVSNNQCQKLSNEWLKDAENNLMHRSKSMSGNIRVMSDRGELKSSITEGLTPPYVNADPTPAYRLPVELQTRPIAPPPYVPPPSYTRAAGSRKKISKSYSSLSNAHQQNTYVCPDATPRNHCMAESYCLAVGGHSILLDSKKDMLPDMCLRPGTDAADPSQLFSGQEKMENTANGCTSLQDNYDAVTKGRLERVLQLCCLMLPPSKRRKLHLLLRLMYKMSHNPKLQILPGAKVRSIVLQAFTPCIIRPREQVLSPHSHSFKSPTDSPDHSDSVALCEKIVTFLMDHNDKILTVPQGLVADVKERVQYLRRPKVKVEDESNSCKMVYDRFYDDRPLTYCEQVTQEEFQQQRLSISQVALAELLNNIIDDEKMTSKEKKKKLKQFQRSHPDIFARRLPCSKSESDVRPKTPLLSRPLLRLRNMKY